MYHLSCLLMFASINRLCVFLLINRLDTEEARARNNENLTKMIEKVGNCSVDELHQEKTSFNYAKTNTLISCAVTAQLISSLCFRYIDSTIPLLPKSKISNF